MGDDKPVMDYGAILADLEAKKVALESLIASVRMAAASGIVSVGDFVSATSGAGTSTPSISSTAEIPNGAFHGKSIPEAAKAYLSMIKKKQTTREIAEALRRGGMETTSSKFEQIVHAVLDRSKKASGEFVRVGNAWALATWYPATMRASSSQQDQKINKKRKKAKKAKRSAPKDPIATGKPAESKTDDEIQRPSDRIVIFLTRNPQTHYSATDISSALKINGIQLFLGKLVKAGRIHKTAEGTFHG